MLPRSASGNGKESRYDQYVALRLASQGRTIQGYKPYPVIGRPAQSRGHSRQVRHGKKRGFGQFRLFVATVRGALDGAIDSLPDELRLP